MIPDQFFKAFYHNWCESNWPVVVEAGNVKSLRQGDDGGGLQASWDSGLGQGQVENPCEDSSQLICRILYTSGDAMGSSSLPQVRSVHLTSCSVSVKLMWTWGMVWFLWVNPVQLSEQLPRWTCSWSDIGLPAKTVFFSQQPPDPTGHPGLLVGVNLHLFVHSDSVYAVFYGAQHCH